MLCPFFMRCIIAAGTSFYILEIGIEKIYNTKDGVKNTAWKKERQNDRNPESD